MSTGGEGERRQYNTLTKTAIHQLSKAEDLSHLWIAVDNRLVLDLSRSVGVPQRAECFLRVRVGWADTSYHHRVAVTT